MEPMGTLSWLNFIPKPGRYLGFWGLGFRVEALGFRGLGVS